MILVVMCLPPVCSQGSESTRPTQEEPTLVSVSTLLLNLEQVDAVTQSITANLYTELGWNDPRLAHTNASKITLNLSEIWHPQIQFVNQKQVVSTFPPVAEVEPDGRVTVRQRIWGNFSAPMQLHDFPFDTQTLNFQVVSVGNAPDEVVMVPDPERMSGIAEQLTLPDWTIVDWETATEEYVPIKGADAVAGYRFSVEVERRIGYYVVKVIVPLVLIVAMSWIVFWIDPRESGSQISVSVTTMLTLIAYRFAMGSVLPRVSYVTKLDAFILGATLLVFLALLEVITTSNLTKTDRLTQARRVDKWSRLVFPTAFLLLAFFSLVG